MRGFRLLQFVAIEAELRHNAWAKIVNQHVGARDQVGQYRFALLTLQVDHDRALASVHRDERGRDIAFGRTNPPTNIAVRAFYLYDFRLVGAARRP